MKAKRYDELCDYSTLIVVVGNVVRRQLTFVAKKKRAVDGSEILMAKVVYTVNGVHGGSVTITHFSPPAGEKKHPNGEFLPDIKYLVPTKNDEVVELPCVQTDFGLNLSVKPVGTDKFVMEDI